MDCWTSLVPHMPVTVVKIQSEDSCCWPSACLWAKWKPCDLRLGWSRVSCSHLFKWSPFSRDHELWSVGKHFHSTFRTQTHRSGRSVKPWNKSCWQDWSRTTGQLHITIMSWTVCDVKSIFSLISIPVYLSLQMKTAELERGCKGQAKISICCTSAAEVQSEINSETALRLPWQQLVKCFCKNSIDTNVSSMRGQPTPGFLFCLKERTFNSSPLPQEARETNKHFKPVVVLTALNASLNLLIRPPRWDPSGCQEHDQRHSSITLPITHFYFCISTDSWNVVMACGEPQRPSGTPLSEAHAGSPLTRRAEWRGIKRLAVSTIRSWFKQVCVGVLYL